MVEAIGHIIEKGKEFFFFFFLNKESPPTPRSPDHLCSEWHPLAGADLRVELCDFEKCCKVGWFRHQAREVLNGF
jgi:hypothetical protein